MSITILTGGCLAPYARADDIVLGARSSASLRFETSAYRGDRPSHDIQFRLNQTATLEAGEHFAAYAALQIEPVTDIRPGERRAFRGEGLYAEELFVQWTDDALTLRAGKFIPTFGRAWYLTPGRFNTVFVSDYEIVEQTGIEISYAMTTEAMGRHAISLSDTMGDRTFLSQSMFTNRGQVHLSDGGPSNTRWPQSVSVAYDASHVPLFGGVLGAQIAAASLGQGANNRGQERLATTGIDLAIPVSLNDSGSERMEVRGLLEVARRWDTDGFKGLNADYLTAAIALRRPTWAAGLVYTHRTRAPEASRRQQDATFEADATRFLGNGFSATLGYVYDTVAGAQSHTVALQLGYSFTHCGECRLIKSRRF